jgi:hypothetical protein
MTLAAGTKLGPYEIDSQLGAGGMGEVYRARDTRLDRIVAIKVLPTHLADRSELRERFERVDSSEKQSGGAALSRRDKCRGNRRVLKVSPDTVLCDWRLAKAWLTREMAKSVAPGNDT